jgi:hypothetical protein
LKERGKRRERKEEEGWRGEGLCPEEEHTLRSYKESKKIFPPSPTHHNMF